MPTVMAIPGSGEAAPRSALARYGSIVRRLATSEGRTLVDIDVSSTPEDVAELAAEQITATAAAERDVTEVMLLGDSVAWSLGTGGTATHQGVHAVGRRPGAGLEPGF